MDQQKRIYSTQVKKHSLYRTKYTKGSTLVTSFSPDGIIACSFVNGAVEMVDMSGKLLSSYRHPLDNILPVTCIRWIPGMPDKFMYTGASGIVQIGNISDLSTKFVAKEDSNELYTLDFINNGSHFVAAGKILPFKMYDSESGRVIRTFGQDKGGEYSAKVPSGHNKRIFCVRADPSHPNLFVSGGWDNFVILWDSNAPKPFIMRFVGPHLAGDGLDIMNEQLLTCSWTAKNSLQLWDLRKVQLIMNYKCQSGKNGTGTYLYTGRFANKDVIITGGSGSNSLQIFKTNSETMVNEVRFDGSIFTCDSMKSGKNIVFGGASSSVHIFDMMEEKK